MNRYSRIVTQPKDQGAAQVSSLRRRRGRPAQATCRQCCTQQKASPVMLTSKRLWSVLVASGELHTSQSPSSCLNCAQGMKETRKLPCNTREKMGRKLTTTSNRCNSHLLRLGQVIKASIYESDMIGYQFGTVGVSDGISNGTAAMNYSLQSRDLIADQVETAAGGHWLDGMVVVPGCDKNMPGVLMAREWSTDCPNSSLTTATVGRLNRPGLMVYGGTIRPGSCDGQPQLDVISAFQSYGKYLQDGKTPEAEAYRYSTVRNACPGPGACGGVGISGYDPLLLYNNTNNIADVHREHHG
jgi:dihydroxyacid dehydratase/phosphogluconate dehydratase